MAHRPRGRSSGAARAVILLAWFSSSTPFRPPLGAAAAASSSSSPAHEKVGFASTALPTCRASSERSVAVPERSVLAAALRDRPEGSRWCAARVGDVDAAEAKERRRFDACMAKKEVRYFCRRKGVAGALELELAGGGGGGGGGTFAAMRRLVTEAFTRAVVIPSSTSAAAAANQGSPRQPRVFFWGDSHTRLLHQTLLCLWPEAPEDVYPKNKGLFQPGHLLRKFTDMAKNPVNTRNGFWHGDVVVVNQGLWFNDKRKYESEMTRFARAVAGFQSAAPPGFRLTVVWVDSTVQHFGSSSDGRYVKGSSKNTAARPGRLASCKAFPWSRLRSNAWRNVISRRIFDAGGGDGNVTYRYFRLEDFAWDLSSQHPGVRRMSKGGGYVMDCAHYCVNYGGLPHFTLLAVLLEAALAGAGEEEAYRGAASRGGEGDAAARGDSRGGGSVPAAEEEGEYASGYGPGGSQVPGGDVSAAKAEVQEEEPEDERKATLDPDIEVEPGTLSELESESDPREEPEREPDAVLGAELELEPEARTNAKEKEVKAEVLKEKTEKALAEVLADAAPAEVASVETEDQIEDDEAAETSVDGEAAADRSEVEEEEEDKLT